MRENFVVRRRLRRIERAFEMADPQWVTMMRDRPGVAPAGHRLSIRVVLAVLGTAVIVTGAVAAAFLLIFAGVLVLMVAACLHVGAAYRKRGR